MGRRNLASANFCELQFFFEDFVVKNSGNDSYILFLLSLSFGYAYVSYFLTLLVEVGVFRLPLLPDGAFRKIYGCELWDARDFKKKIVGIIFRE